MSKKRKVEMAPPQASAEGFRLAVQNGQALFAASRVLMNEGSPIALGLAQLGQEEIGKSMLLLAAIDLKPVEEGWKWFWREWRDHRAKAHRAYLYEIVHPQRIELKGPDGKIYDGGPLRENIAHEKEAAFYVDYDSLEKRFVSPMAAVSPGEAWSRIMTLGYLGLTASAVHDTLFENAEDIQFRFTTFSGIAFRLCTEKIFQQDMPAILEEFSARSERHAVFVASLTRHVLAIKLKSTSHTATVDGAESTSSAPNIKPS